MTGHQLDVHLTARDADAALRADARAGLTARPKQLPPKWCYDARGSELFERITELPEYYPTRTERALLDRSAAEIAAVSGADTLAELGSGSAMKTPAAARRVRRRRDAALVRAPGRQRVGAATGHGLPRCGVPGPVAARHALSLATTV